MAKGLAAAMMSFALIGPSLGLMSGCGEPSPVRLTVQVVLAHCPLVTSWVVSPLQASAPGGAIDVSVTAHGMVVDGGSRPLEFMWSATAGTFSDAAAPTSVYKCATAGPQILTVSVTDKDRAVPCADVLEIPVKCVDKGP
jgi:hypothetical protein